MKFLIVGLGSMGKRRIRNLQYLDAGQILGFDPREDRRKEAQEKYGIEVFEKFDHAMAEEPDALIISTPPDMHMEYALIAANNNKHFFTEASVVNEGMDELIALCRNKTIVAAPSCTMRFQPSIRVIKNLVESNKIGKVLAFIYHSGQYLPDWHPWEDYRTFYVAKRETGACREIVAFELVWLTWIFGEIAGISCLKDKLSSLEIDIDDIYQILVRSENNILGSLTVDVISRIPYRQLKLISEEGVITWDWSEKCVRVFTAKDKKWHTYVEEKGTVEKGYVVEEEMYIDEMRHFVNAITGKERYMYTFEQDKRILDTLYAAERSSIENVHVILSNKEILA